MLSEDAKKTIDALPKEELLQEINKKIGLGSKTINTRTFKHALRP